MSIQETFQAFWDYRLLAVGESTLTVGVLVSIVLGVILTWAVAATSRRLVSGRLLQKADIDTGSRYALGAIVFYIVLALGVFIVLDTIGLKISSLAFLGGLIGIGIGFGLQNIASNFISGIILLFERPVRVGDVVIVNGNMGVVEEINIRKTNVRTFKNVRLYVPNSEFINGTVENWSSEDETLRVDIPVGVSYGDDPKKVTQILLDLSRAHPDILEDPAPDVKFVDFGDSSLDFSLRVWIASATHVLSVPSDLRYQIVEAFRQNDIEIPFPQRDIHVRKGDAKLGVEISRTDNR